MGETKYVKLLILNDKTYFGKWQVFKKLKCNECVKASFNNVFTLKKNLNYMSLYAISVFDKVYKWSPEKNCTSKAPLSASKKWK